MVQALHKTPRTASEEDTEMSKGSNRRPTLKPEMADKNWDEFLKNARERRAREAIQELSAEIHGNLHKIKQVTH